eukprot:jgi/Chrzof1/5859/Cz16g18120.t1
MSARGVTEGVDGLAIPTTRQQPRRCSDARQCSLQTTNYRLQKATVGSKGSNGKKGNSSKHKPPGTRTPCMFNDQCQVLLCSGSCCLIQHSKTCNAAGSTKACLQCKYAYRYLSPLPFRRYVSSAERSTS